MAESKLSPLQFNVALVNPDGTPTPYFIQLLQQLYEEKKITDDAVANDIIAGAGLTGGGALADGPVTLSASVQAILNLVSTTRGAILYRGAAVWSALLPGAAGQFLQTAGAGADPLWAAGGGGGSGTPWYWSPPLAASFALSNGAGATNMVLTDDTDCGLIIEPNTFAAGLSHAFALRNLASSVADWTMTARFEGACNGEFEYNGFGLCLYESATNKFIDYYFQRTYSQSPSIAVCNWTSAGVFSSDQRILHSTKHPWLRVIHAGGNYTFQISACGKRWITIIVLGDTAFLAGRADKVGFTMGCSTSANIYWQYTCQNFSIV